MERLREGEQKREEHTVQKYIVIMQLRQFSLKLRAQIVFMSVWLSFSPGHAPEYFLGLCVCVCVYDSE